MGKGDKVEIMESGELELRKVFEEVTTKNVKTVIQFSQDTRKLLREAQEEIKHLRNVILNREEQLSQLQQQVGQLLQKSFNEGT